MKKATLYIDAALYLFYRKIGQQAGGLPPEQVMADALFKLAGELALNALHARNAAGGTPPSGTPQNRPV